MKLLFTWVPRHRQSGLPIEMFETLLKDSPFHDIDMSDQL